MLTPDGEFGEDWPGPVVATVTGRAHARLNEQYRGRHGPNLRCPVRLITGSIVIAENLDGLLLCRGAQNYRGLATHRAWLRASVYRWRDVGPEPL